MATDVQGALTVREAAQRYGCTPETVRQWIWDGRLLAKKVGNRRFMGRTDRDMLCLPNNSPTLAERVVAMEDIRAIRERIYARVGYIDVVASLDEAREGLL